MKELKISQTITARDEDTLNQYLAEIHKIPLLNVEEEFQLTSRIKDGDQSALERLIRTNLRFVVSVAKKYQHRGLSLGDLINEGNLGLIKAASRFDHTKGFKFISFAVWWIRQSIMLALAEQTRLIRLPLNLVNSISLINKTSMILEQRLERMPTPEEIADEIDLGEQRIMNYLSKAKKCLSLHAVIDQEIGNTLLDVLTDQYFEPDKSLTKEADVYDMSRTVKLLLSKKEEHVLRLYYGLGGTQPLQMDEISRQLNITKERVRQLRHKALHKLRLKMRAT